MGGRRKYWKGALWALAALLFVGAMALTLDPLGSFNALMPKDWASKRVAEGVAYGAGERLKLDVYAPRAASARPRPVIVFFYGGSWNSGRRQGYAFAARALAARGFVVIVPDYRLVPEARYPDFLQDCAAAVRWARRQSGRYGGDGDRIVLIGHSAGAYNAAMLALDPEPARDATGPRFGPWSGWPDPTTSSRWTTPRRSPPSGPGLARPRPSPSLMPRRGAPPALLLHGDGDSRVKPRHSRKLAGLLGKAGGEVRLKLYPGLGHVGILTALAIPFRRQAPVLADVASFAHDATRDIDKQ